MTFEVKAALSGSFQNLASAPQAARTFRFNRRFYPFNAFRSLHSGHIFANVEDRHRSVEFIALLKLLDAHYPADGIIRVVLDNHSAHISKETMAYLHSRPGRFEYVHTPKHGSWLNLIKCTFSKMARTFLRHIRVTSKDELKHRILKGIAEINAAPVELRWNKFDRGVT